MLQILPLQIPVASKLLGKGEVGKVSAPTARGAPGRITFLTAGLADAVSRRHPEVGGAGVKHDGEPLGRGPDAHNPVVLCLQQGGTAHSAPRLQPAAPEEGAWLGASPCAPSAGAVQFLLHGNAPSVSCSTSGFRQQGFAPAE